MCVVYGQAKNAKGGLYIIFNSAVFKQFGLEKGRKNRQCDLDFSGNYLNPPATL